MAEISQYTSKFRVGPPPSTSAAGGGSLGSTDGKITKRNRQPLSCQPCRIRKLKCDRGHPCDSCIRRGEAETCVYGKVPSGNGATVRAGSAVTASNQRGIGNNGDGGNVRQLANLHVSSGSARAQDRLQKLEDMVRQMIDEREGGELLMCRNINKNREGDASNENKVAEINDPARPGAGNSQAVQMETEDTLNRTRHGTNYRGSTHWSAILDHIQDLRTDLTEARVDDYENDTPSSSDVVVSERLSRSDPTDIFAASQPLSLEAILEKYLPSRQEADRHLSTYFNAKYLVIPLIHTQQFSRQYEKFWDDPLHTSPMWISILFSILYIADSMRYVNATHPEGSRSSSHDPSPGRSTNSAVEGGPHSVSDHDAASPDRDAYLSASSQCLILGDYVRPQAHLIQALAMNLQCKYTLTLDSSREVALLFSFLVRQAYNMSYHRDCSNFPVGQFTPFEAEMRRRTWALLKMVDIMISFQLGQPGCIVAGTSDTQYPANIQDIDFDEDCKSLPRERESNEASPMLYFVVKCRFMHVYGEVVQYTLSFPNADRKDQTQTEQETVMRLDAEVRKCAEQLPAVLKPRPMRQSFSDPSYLIMLRQNLEFLMLKGLCVLHRRYMIRHRTKASHEGTYSRKVVLESSTQLVNSFIEAHDEFQPGGQLYADRWMLSSFKINDFCLALVLMFFVFWTERNQIILQSRKDSEEDRVRDWLKRDTVMRSTYGLLVRATQVCAEYGKRSEEARRVADVLTLALGKVESAAATAAAASKSVLLQGRKSYEGASPGWSTSSGTASSTVTPAHRSNEMDLAVVNLAPLNINGPTRTTNPNKTALPNQSPGIYTNDGHSVTDSDYMAATWVMDTGVPVETAMTSIQPDRNDPSTYMGSVLDSTRTMPPVMAEVPANSHTRSVWPSMTPPLFTNAYQSLASPQSTQQKDHAPNSSFASSSEQPMMESTGTWSETDFDDFFCNYGVTPMSGIDYYQGESGVKGAAAADPWDLPGFEANPTVPSDLDIDYNSNNSNNKTNPESFNEHSRWMNISSATIGMV